MINSEQRSAVITQSNYIPWKGYFDQINSADVFVFYDCVQYTRRDWRNRNIIKTSEGPKWLTIPVNAKGNFHTPIAKIEISDESWAEKHWQILRQAYRKADCFRQMETFVKDIYERARTIRYLSEVNKLFIKSICGFLDISTPFRNSDEFELSDDRTERLCRICQELGASVYISGPAAKEYLVESIFFEKHIDVQWFSYQGYREYPQLHGEFIHGVSVLDLLFCTGNESRKYIQKLM